MQFHPLTRARLSEPRRCSLASLVIAAPRHYVSRRLLLIHLIQVLLLQPRLLHYSTIPIITITIRPAPSALPFIAGAMITHAASIFFTSALQQSAPAAKYCVNGKSNNNNGNRHNGKSNQGSAGAQIARQDVRSTLRAPERGRGGGNGQGRGRWGWWWVGELVRRRGAAGGYISCTSA